MIPKQVCSPKRKYTGLMKDMLHPNPPNVELEKP